MDNLNNSSEELPSQEIPTVSNLLEQYEIDREDCLECLEAFLIVFPELTDQKITKIYRRHHSSGSKLAAQLDGFNPSRIFQIDGQNITALRVEERQEEGSSQVRFFSLENENIGHLILKAPILKDYQDPFYSGQIQGQEIFGAVKIAHQEGGGLTYKTDFYKLDKNLQNLEIIGQGPEMMKDIRLIDRQNGQIGVFIRPQNGENNQYGRGKIGYLEISSISELAGALNSYQEKATIFQDMFAEGEWGAVNDLHLLKNGKIGVIGHIARFVSNSEGIETGVKEYFATSAVFDPETQEFSHLQIIMREEDLEQKLGQKIEQKNPSLKSILFPGGSKRYDNGTIIFLSGIGDTHAVEFTLKDPFLEDENI